MASHRPRDMNNASQIDHLALSRAHHLQSRDHRIKSVSDDEPDQISDWSDSDRECSPLSDIEWTSSDPQYDFSFDNEPPKQISHFDMVRPAVNVAATPVPVIDDSATSTRTSFNNEIERPKTQYIKKIQTSPAQTLKHLPAPLLPGRRAQNKTAHTRRPSIRSMTNSQSSISSRTQKTNVTYPSRLHLRRETASTSISLNTNLTKDSRLSPNSSIHSHDKSLGDDSITHHRRNLSPNLSQASVPRVYEMKKIFVDDTDYGRLTDTSNNKPYPARNRQKWGTILHPPFPLGYQQVAPEQIHHAVERLANPIRCRDRHTSVQSPSKRYLSVEETEALINRLNKVKTVRSPDQYWPMPRPSRSVKTLNNATTTSNWKGAGIPA